MDIHYPEITKEQKIKNNNIIPRPLKAYKVKVIGPLTMMDLLIVIFVLIYSLLIIAFIPGWVSKIIFLSCISILLMFLVLPWHPKFKSIKPYKYFSRIISKMVQKKVYTKTNLENLNPYDKIDDGLIKLKNNDYIAFIQISSDDIALLHESDKNRRFVNFKNFMNGINLSWSIIKDNKLKNYSGYRKNLNGKNRSVFHKVNTEILDNAEKRGNGVEDVFYICVSGKKKNINDSLANIVSSLSLAKLSPNPVNEQDLLTIVNNFYNDNLKLDEEKNIYLDAKFIHFNKKSISFDSKTFSRILTFSELPRFSSEGWLEVLNVDKNISWISKFYPFDKDQATKKLDSVIRNLEVEQLMSKKNSQNIIATDYTSQMKKLNQQINNEGEKLFSSYFFIILKGKSKKELNLLQNKLVSKLGKQYQLFPTDFLQFDCMNAMLPKTTLISKNIPSIELPSWALATSFPFINNAMSDEYGHYLGFTSKNSNVFFDPTLISNTRQNSNMIIFGTSGSGKSTLAKKIVKDQFVNGTKLFIIDPEREFKSFCEVAKGTWINFGSDKNNKKEPMLNPLHFFSIDDSGVSQLSTHLQFLEQFFKTLFTGIKFNVMNTLKQLLINLYSNFGLNNSNNIDSIPSEDFPIMSDILWLIKKELSIDDSNYEKSELEMLKNYFGVFEFNSPESQLWNGKTNVDLDDSYLNVFDLHSLTIGSNKRLIDAQLFLLLKFLHKQMIKNRGTGEKIILVIDESHLLIDEENPIGLDFLYQLVKRSRKYSTGTILITQNTRDFIGGAESIKRKTHAIINQAQYIFMMKMNPGDIDDMDNVYKSVGGLTKLEKEQINMFSRGQCIFVNGNTNRSVINIDVHEKELILWD